MREKLESLLLDAVHQRVFDAALTIQHCAREWKERGFPRHRESATREDTSEPEIGDSPVAW